MDRQPCVYIITNQRNGTLYVGVTSNLSKRVWQHKNHVVEGFSQHYCLDKLIWYEIHNNMETAISREKAIKKWSRRWKLRLIEEMNPEWRDLYKEVC